MKTFGSALADGRTRLRQAGIDSAALDARLLLAAAAELDAAALIARSPEPLPELAAEKFASHLKKRLRGEPVARILGEKEFWGVPFVVNAATLIPRPETELLIEAVLAEADRLPDNPEICDLGTGSGAILIALLKELPQATGVGVDLSEEALAVARDNAARLGVESRISFRQGDFATTPDEAFDVLVSNPPYIRSDAISGLSPEVRDYDPPSALDGGSDGLTSYRSILARAPRLLKPGGFAAFEIGDGQADVVVELFRAAGLEDANVIADLAGIERVVTARRPVATGKPQAKKALGKLLRWG